VSLRFALQPWRQSSATGLLLIPMAGLAIGLVQTASQLVPEQATVIAAVVLGAVTLFETLGPPMAAFAFGLAGEAAASTPVRKQSPWRLKHEVQVDVSALVVQKPEDVEVTEEATETVKRRFRLWPFAGKA
jgi:hypothetical protein